MLISVLKKSGTNQSSGGYYQRMHDYFTENIEAPASRSVLAIRHRWLSIQKAVNKFCGFFTKYTSNCSLLNCCRLHKIQPQVYKLQLPPSERPSGCTIMTPNVVDEVLLQLFTGFFVLHASVCINELRNLWHISAGPHRWIF